MMGHKRRASILIAFAHPDDEIFHAGMLAHLAERGARVTLVCATDGEAGKAHPSVGPVDDLGALRVEELRRSCAHLGIDEPVLLRFHDSARNERQRHHDPHALANVDMLDVEAVMRGIIAEVKPHVVLTFEPHGGYYHPDHLAIHRAATAAFFASGVLGADAPERLFYTAMLREVFLTFAEASRGRGFLDGLDPDAFSTSPEMVAVTLDARPYLERKLSALTAHQSAFGVTADMLKNPPPPVAQMLRAFRPVLEREVFVLGGTRGRVPRWPLADFFDGLETAELTDMASNHSDAQSRAAGEKRSH